MPRPTTNIDAERGARIRYAREKPRLLNGRRYTQQGFAEQLGKSLATILNWEKGRVVADSDLLAIATITGHDFVWLKTGKGGADVSDLENRLTPSEIKAIRMRSEMTLAMFADTLGVSVRTLQNWESGNAKPRASQVESILSMDRTIGEIIEDVGGRREPPRLDLLSEAVDYIRGLSNEQYEQLHTALEGILRHARGEAVPELLGYAAIVNAHLRQLQLREGAPKSGSDIR